MAFTPITGSEFEPKLVEEVRAAIRREYEKAPNEFDARDIESVCKDPTWVARFLARKRGDPKAAIHMLVDTLKYRKTQEIPSMKDQDFPEEFYSIGGCFVYEPDLAGNATMYCRIRFHRRVPEVMDLVKSFFVHTYDKMDMATKGSGMVIIYDLTGAGFKNADLEFAFWLSRHLQSHCPAGIAYILVHNLPSLLVPIWRLVMNWIPGDQRGLFKLSNDKTITDFVARDKLPDFMGGTCTTDYRTVPPNCIEVEKLARMKNISEKKLQGLIEYYNSLSDADQ